MAESGVGGVLLFITQIALLVGNYVYQWNLPFYILWAPVLSFIILLVIFAIVVIIGVALS